MPSGLSWIEDLMSEIEDVETPAGWIYWSLLAAISGAVGNNYFLRTFKGNHIYSTNLYVILLGESGLGKAYGINLAKQLVSAADSTRVIAGRSSIQAIVTELSKQKSRPNGLPPIADSRGFIVNGELSSAIIADVDALSILTDLYDGKVLGEEWTNMLKLSGKETLKNPCITALFGTAPAGFYDSIPQANIDGGYIGRNLIIYEETRARTVNPLDDDDEITVDRVKDYLVPKYSVHLRELYKTKGRLIVNNGGKKIYNEWRFSWRSKKHNDKTGFMNRVPDHTLKVAMLLCLSRYNSGGVINELDIEEAISKVTGLIYSNKMTSVGKGLDPGGQQSQLVLNILLRADNNELTRKRLLSQGHGNFDSFQLDKIVETLSEIGWIDKERIVAGVNSDWLYKLSGEPKENYLKWKKSNEKDKT